MLLKVVFSLPKVILKTVQPKVLLQPKVVVQSTSTVLIPIFQHQTSPTIRLQAVLLGVDPYSSTVKGQS